MRCLFLNVHYLRFINSHYEKNPGLEFASYEEQKASMNATFFGDGDLYTEGLRAAGWEADDLVQNCDQLQKAWAKENGYSYDEPGDIWLEQIRHYEPDVLYSQATWLIDYRLESYPVVRPLVKLLVGQQSLHARIFENTGYDVLFSAQSRYVRKYKEVGVNTYYLPFAFEPRILDLLDVEERDLDVTFVGQVTGQHKRRRVVLEHLSTLGLDCWGPGTENTGNRYHGEAWGLDMFGILRRSKMTVNCNIDFGLPEVGNMRLYEGTGCGALMITDHGLQLDELFEKDVEIVTYKSPEECLGLVRYYLAHPDEAAEIAKRGQERTLKDHTYTKRMEYVAGILEAML